MPTLKKEQQQALLLGGIMVALAGVLVYQFAWHPAAKPVASARPPSARLRLDLENSKRQLGRLPELERATAERKKAVGALEERLSKTVAVDTLLADLSAMAAAAHVRIESLEPLEVQGAAEGSQGLYTVIPVHIRAKGGYHQLGAFLNALEGQPRMMRLVHLEISNTADEPWRQSAEMVVSTFRLLEPKEVSR